MSTFDGRIPEFPGLSVDRFEDLTSKLFFLSHCHWDHMQGLTENKDKLKAKIVLSAASAVFVKNQFGISDENLCVLKVSGNMVPLQLDILTKLNIFSHRFSKRIDL